ncbi:hypothetical protein NDU88_005646 [Pleurodeles waltl]|uniref:Uncharacterized protein n=1 Tax=Pleurodeles waltl TaxID=8319 RepID=A0AAV7LLP4_PLEWA|nr:hypothetical protein NDU88_005646 [Pleurodeles waltl]
MHPADLRWAWGPCRRRVLQIEGRQEARRERGRAPAVDPCRGSADGAPPSCRGGRHQVSGAALTREARVRPGGLGPLPARSSGLRCRAEAAVEVLPPEVPLLAGIKNWRHAEDQDPAGDPGGAPGGRGRKSVIGRGWKEKISGDIPRPPHPCSNKREPEGLEAWFRPPFGPGPGRSASWTAAEPRLRAERWRTTPWDNWISWVLGRTWLTLDPGRNDSRD